MSRLFLVSIIFLFALKSFGYSPTLNSLLRNGNNIEVASNTVQANLSIVEIDPQTNTPLKSEIEMPKKEMIKLLVVNANENNPLLTQVNYKGGLLDNASVINYTQSRIKDMKIFSNENENFDGEFFYGVLLMLINNSANPLMESLKKYVENVKFNDELINKEKLQLLKNYKIYLEAFKSKKDNKQEEIVVINEEESPLENPLAPSEPEQREKVRKLIKAPFFNKDPLVTRIKMDNEFFWVVDEKNLYLRFDTNHRIMEMKLKTQMGSLEWVFGKYVIHGAQMEFPEFFWFKDLTGKKFEIRAKRLTNFNDSLGDHNKRLKRYQKYSQENNIMEPQTKPSFLL